MRRSLTVREHRNSRQGLLYFTLTSLLLVLTISACGNRGPLYLPDESQAAGRAAPEAQAGETDPGAEEEEETAEDQDPPAGMP